MDQSEEQAFQISNFIQFHDMFYFINTGIEVNSLMSLPLGLIHGPAKANFAPHTMWNIYGDWVNKSIFCVWNISRRSHCTLRAPTSRWGPLDFILGNLCSVGWVTCNFFGFLCCFRQGRVYVTLRNKKNIGLLCFMSVSSSYFLLLCRTNTNWWPKKSGFL